MIIPYIWKKEDYVVVTTTVYIIFHEIVYIFTYINIWIYIFIYIHIDIYIYSADVGMIHIHFL